MGRYVLGRKERRRREGEENDWWSNGSGLGNVNGNNGGLEKKKDREEGHRRASHDGLHEETSCVISRARFCNDHPQKKPPRTMPLELLATTDKEELLLCQANNYKEWGAPLKLEHYQHRDNINYGSSYMAIDRADPTKSNGGVYFVLKDTDTGEVEAACEILIRDCWVVNGTGKLVDARSAVIGSVYTVEKYRGKGNASLMMKELLRKMKETYLTGDCDVAFLYSAVGEYYSRFGYRSFNVPLFEFDLSGFDAKSSKFGPSIEHEVLHMDYDEVATDYRARVRHLMEKNAGTSGQISFALKPSAEIFEWFANRARAIYWATRHPHLSPPPAVEHERQSAVPVDAALTVATGFVVRDSRHGQLSSYVTFYPEFHSGHCYITAMHAVDADTAVSLLALVLKQCAVWQLDKVYAWISDVGDFDNTGRDPLGLADRLQQSCAAAGVGFRVEQTNDSLSAIQALHGMAMATEGGEEAAQEEPPAVTRWVANGKWCWF